MPSLYLGEALPFSAVMLISVIMFKELGLTDGQITVYTGWLGLPWVIKPIWSPIIDNLKTKRWWIVSMQFFMGVALALVAFTLPTSFWLQGSFAIFMLIAFASATHDISADGFYIIGLPDKEQELYVGVRNTFYRIGMVIGQGGLVLFAGYMQGGHLGETLQSVSASWMVVFFILGGLMFLLGLYHAFILPKVETTVHDRFNFAEQMREFGRTLKVFITKPHLISALCFILLFLSSKHATPSDYSENLGLRNFGLITTKGTKRHPVREWFLKKELKASLFDSDEESVEYAAVRIAAYCDNHGVDKIAVLSSDSTDAVQSAVSDLTSALRRQEVDLIATEKVGKDSRALTELVSTGQCILVEQLRGGNRLKAAELLQFCKENDVDVIGAVGVMEASVS